MLDTLRLTLPSVEVAHENMLTVMRRVVQGKEVSDVLYHDGREAVIGDKAYHNAPSWQLTIERKPVKGGGVTVRTLQFSAPKVVRGNNYQPADEATLREALGIVEGEMEKAGVRVDLREARLSRVDATRNAETRFPIQAYAPVFELMTASRMKDKRQYPSGYLIKNKARELCFYDKREELENQLATKREGVPEFDLSSIPSNVLRAEVRLLNHVTSKRELRDLVTVGDLLEEFDSVADMYHRTIKNAFEFDPSFSSEQEVSDIERLFRYEMQNKPRGFVTRTVRMLGARKILEGLGEARLRGLLRQLGMPRQNVHREVTRIVKDSTQFALHQPSLFSESRLTLGDLYSELKAKLVA